MAKIIKNKLEEFRNPYKEYLDNESFNEALRYLELNKDKIYEFISDLIVRIDKLANPEEVPR